MLSLDTAKALADAGVLWQPAAGDRFAVNTEALRAEVFWISELTINVHHFETQSVLGFNGTTEWALDSIPLDQAIWLPREDQLRTLIGSRLTSLTAEGPRWSVAVRVGEQELSFTDDDAEEAYAQALLAIARSAD